MWTERPILLTLAQRPKRAVGRQVFGYPVPLPRIHKFRHEAAVGFDFKRSNNDLLAGGQNVLQTSDTDIDQFAASYTGVLPDKVGQTSFGLEVYYSPGHLSPNNNDSDFNQLRVNASADYFYGRLNIERITRLPYDFPTCWRMGPVVL